MKKLLILILFLLCRSSICSAQPRARLLMPGDGFADFDITELPGLGLCINLDGDSLIFLDDPELPFLHLEAKKDMREIIVCDSTIYGSVGNAVYADTCSVPVIVLDNNMFHIYPAYGPSFYVCTADSAYSHLMLVDPVAGAYSVVTEVQAAIQKVVANDKHTFALIEDYIVALGADNEMVPLYQGEQVNDIALSPLGLFVATEKGLFSTSTQSDVRLWSERCYKRVWWIDESLYLQDSGNNLFAVDGLLEGGAQ